MAIDYVALKNECVNNPNNYSATVGGVTRTLSQWFASGDFSICAQILNALTATFWVYRTAIPTLEVFDAIVWANLTPADTPDGTQTWANHSLACQGKQFNLQTILIGGQGSLNGARSNIRAGLQDALTAIPSGSGGVSRSAGWVTIRDTVLARAATRAEKLYANVVGGDGSTPALAATMTFEGNLTDADIQAAKAA